MKRAGKQADRGSSPRVRGKPDRLLAYRDHRRLIPARAGKTLHLTHSAPAPLAHPRACGENPVQQGALGILAGSSPRVRGKLLDVEDDAVRPGLIPARAGKTEDEYGADPMDSAHPRACGENA